MDTPDGLRQRGLGAVQLGHAAGDGPAPEVRQGDRHVEGIADDIDRAEGRGRRKDGDTVRGAQVGVVDLDERGPRQLRRQQFVKVRPMAQYLLRGQVGRRQPELFVEHLAPDGVGPADEGVDGGRPAAAFQVVRQQGPQPRVCRTGGRTRATRWTPPAPPRRVPPRRRRGPRARSGRDASFDTVKARVSEFHVVPGLRPRPHSSL